MNKDKRFVFWSLFWSVSIWVVIILLGAVFLLNYKRPQFFTVSMADENLSTKIGEHEGVVDWSQLQVDSMNVVHLATDIDSVAYLALRGKILREEVRAGRLMSTDQMTGRITGYYDKLIDVLIALFVLFSIASYFVIDNKFKKKYEEDKGNFIEEIKLSLMDSQSFHDDLINGISTKIESQLVTEDDIQGLKDQIDKNKDDFKALVDAYDTLATKIVSREEVAVNENNK